MRTKVTRSVFCFALLLSASVAHAKIQNVPYEPAQSAIGLGLGRALYDWIVCAFDPDSCD